MIPTNSYKVKRCHYLYSIPSASGSGISSFFVDIGKNICESNYLPKSHQVSMSHEKIVSIVSGTPANYLCYENMCPDQTIQYLNV